MSILLKFWESTTVASLQTLVVLLTHSLKTRSLNPFAFVGMVSYLKVSR